MLPNLQLALHLAHDGAAVLHFLPQPLKFAPVRFVLAISLVDIHLERPAPKAPVPPVASQSAVSLNKGLADFAVARSLSLT